MHRCSGYKGDLTHSIIFRVSPCILGDFSSSNVMPWINSRDSPFSHLNNDTNSVTLYGSLSDDFCLIRPWMGCSLS
ncbi:hypothetical protein B0O80DRAFT_463546 [Mortierella sp. GBAus27b]|nr:hypothetical protein B0O80DRAFT_463546 [Mortierella sp. GBAus27b]